MSIDQQLTKLKWDRILKTATRSIHYLKQLPSIIINHIRHITINYYNLIIIGVNNQLALLIDNYC